MTGESEVARRGQKITAVRGVRQCRASKGRSKILNFSLALLKAS